MTKQSKIKAFEQAMSKLEKILIDTIDTTDTFMTDDTNLHFSVGKINYDARTLVQSVRKCIGVIDQKETCKTKEKNND